MDFPALMQSNDAVLAIANSPGAVVFARVIANAVVSRCLHPGCVAGSPGNAVDRAVPQMLYRFQSGSIIRVKFQGVYRAGLPLMRSSVYIHDRYALIRARFLREFVCVTVFQAVSGLVSAHRGISGKRCACSIRGPANMYFVSSSPAPAC